MVFGMKNNRNMVDLEIDINSLDNNELAEYLIQLEKSVNEAVQNSNYTIMNILIGYKIKVEILLQNRLKEKVNSIP